MPRSADLVLLLCHWIRKDKIGGVMGTHIHGMLWAEMYAEQDFINSRCFYDLSWWEKDIFLWWMVRWQQCEHSAAMLFREHLYLYVLAEEHYLRTCILMYVTVEMKVWLCQENQWENINWSHAESVQPKESAIRSYLMCCKWTRIKCFSSYPQKPVPSVYY